MKTAFRQIEIVHCRAARDLQARGLFGFHDSSSCPDCVKRDAGFRVHAGDSVFSPFVGYFPDPETVISDRPVYFTR